jgi:glutamate synthase domain-containing protein 1
MPQIRKTIRLPDKNSPIFKEELLRMLNNYTREVGDLINGALQLGPDNLNCYIYTVTDTGNIDTEFNFAHTLKRIPVGYFVISISKAGIVYKGSTAWDIATIYLKCNVANAEVKILVF